MQGRFLTRSYRNIKLLPLHTTDANWKQASLSLYLMCDGKKRLVIFITVYQSDCRVGGADLLTGVPSVAPLSLVTFSLVPQLCNYD